MNIRKGILLLTVLAFSSFTGTKREVKPRVAHILYEVNKLRAEGCYCGHRYMKPVEEVKWNKDLYKSALAHARDMSQFSYFSHYSKKGEDIGVRLDKYGYDLQVAGENLGEGQRSFKEVLFDWKKSKSHCRMLMNPKVEDMAVARFGKYWVQHFGKKLPTKQKYNSGE